MLRAVLDTNVFISGIFFPHGTSNKLLNKWRFNQFEIIVSEPLCQEIIRVGQKIEKRTGMETKVFRSIKSLIFKYGKWVEFSPQAKVCRDPKDNFLNRHRSAH